ncbi:MAG: ribonuclease-3 [Rickettsiales bacterium]|jgi:ribonuclease-3
MRHKLDEFEIVLDYQFRERHFLIEAMTHPSCTTRNNKNYQRLEFLGDSIISMILAEILVKKYQSEQEGSLSKRLAHLVSGDCIWQVAVDIGIDNLIILSKGEESLGGRENKRNLENAAEALIAAIYLDSDFNTTKRIITKLWSKLIEEHITPPKGAISSLQELTQAKNRTLPEYKVLKIGGNDHKPIFEAEVTIDHIHYKAIGHSKKDAQKKVAELALKNFKF